MAEINLLKNELQGRGVFTLGTKGLLSLYVLLAVIALELLAYGGLVIYKKQIEKKVLKAEQQAASIDLEIGQNSEKRLAAISFQRRLNNLQVLLDNHQFWSVVMEELAAHTVKTVRYETMQVSPGTSQITILGNTPSYTELGKLLLGLRTSKKILNTELKTTTQSGKEQGGYKFTMELIFDPQLLLK